MIVLLPVFGYNMDSMSEKDTMLSEKPEETIEETADMPDHAPRPVSPEDESYGELMMRFTAHPVKPKYWFEEFGDHWTCSCGQINKGEICANCGLERNLLRKLFILHKPAAGDSSENSGAQAGNDGMTITLPLSSQGAQGASDLKDPKNAGPSQGSYSGKSSGDAENTSSGHQGLVIGIVILVFLLLLGTGAFLHFVVLPEMQEQTAAKRDSIRISLSENLPIATAQLPTAQLNSYVAAGDMLCKKGKYVKAITYYNKAAGLKDDESIQQKILDAKFGYVQAHQDDGGDYFETYLNELVSQQYDGAQSIYNQFYAWHVDIVANNLEDDFSTDMKNLNRHDTIYFHTTMTGGAPGASIRLYYQIIWPDGTAEKKDIDSSWHAGSHFSSRFQYAMPLFSKAGKLTFEIYDKDSHDLLGKDSVQLKK